MTATNYGDNFGEEFQEHILAVMCLIPGFVVRFRTALDSAYFVNDVHRTVSHALLSHVDKYRKLPTRATLLEDLRPSLGQADMGDVQTAVTKLYRRDVSDANAVIEKVVEFGKTQALVNAVLSAADLLTKGSENNTKIKPLIDEALIVGEDILDVGVDMTSDVEQRHAWYTNPEVAIAGLRTGIVHVDLLMGGGLGEGELGVILAPPGRGKTTTLINVGFGALTDVGRKNVVHYSCEMNERKVTMRYDDRLMGGRVKYKRSDPERYFAELRDRVTRLVRGRLFVKSYPTRTASISTIRAHLALLASRGFDPDLVVVDYADIMKPERRLGEMRHEQAGVYEDLRTLAGEFSCRVWTGSQATRGSLEKEVITIGDFAEAFEKAHVVDAALAFCQTDDEKLTNRARFFAAKLRDHEDGRTVELTIRRDACLIRSTGLLDAGGSRLAGEDTRKTTVKKTVATATAKSRIKSAGGIKKKTLSKKRKKKTGPTPNVQP